MVPTLEKPRAFRVVLRGKVVAEPDDILDANPASRALGSGAQVFRASDGALMSSVRPPPGRPTPP